MTRTNRINTLLTFLSFFFVSVTASANFTQCLETFQAGGNATGGTDFFGRPVNNSRDAVGLTYGACKSLCGTEQEAFNWSVFSQQFSAWLLPWLALVSQLPFGAESRLDNLISGKFPPGLNQFGNQALIVTPQLLSPLDLRPSQLSHSPSLPSILGGQMNVSRASNTPIANTPPEPSSTFNRSHFVSPLATDYSPPLSFSLRMMIGGSVWLRDSSEPSLGRSPQPPP